MPKPAATKTCFDRVIPADIDPERTKSKDHAKKRFLTAAQEHGVSGKIFLHSTPTIQSGAPTWRSSTTASGQMVKN